LPGRTREALDSAWTDTQSCGFFFVGGGVVDLLGVGVGVGVLLVLPDGLGLADLVLGGVLFGLVLLVLGLGLAELEVDLLGLGVAVFFVVLGLGDADADAVELCVLVGFALDGAVADRLEGAALAELDRCVGVALADEEWPVPDGTAEGEWPTDALADGLLLAEALARGAVLLGVAEPEPELAVPLAEAAAFCRVARCLALCLLAVCLRGACDFARSCVPAGRAAESSSAAADGRFAQAPLTIGGPPSRIRKLVEAKASELNDSSRKPVTAPSATGFTSRLFAALTGTTSLSWLPLPIPASPPYSSPYACRG
jgi:hypothetical protein